MVDGRLPTAGKRTMRLAGRAKQIPLHVFDPVIIEELLDSGRVDWRDEDADTAAENRRRAADKAKRIRFLRKRATSSEPIVDETTVTFATTIFGQSV